MGKWGNAKVRISFAESAFHHSLPMKALILFLVLCVGLAAMVRRDDRFGVAVDESVMVCQRLGSSIRVDLPRLSPSSHYELRISYPGTVGLL